MSLKNKHCMDSTTLINLNSIEIDFDLLMVSLDKCNRNCNDPLSRKICVSSKTKDGNIKVINIIRGT